MELNFVPIGEILKYPDSYYAHKKDIGESGQNLETLAEHTMLCQQYFRGFLKQNT